MRSIATGERPEAALERESEEAALPERDAAPDTLLDALGPALGAELLGGVLESHLGFLGEVLVEEALDLPPREGALHMENIL